MENLNAEQVKKTLECCTSGYCYIGEGCPLDGGDDDIAKCTSELSKNALALIESQEERIKELTDENDKLHASCTELARVQEENERLERICESYTLQYGTAADKEVFLKKERADTVRKMLSEIKERCIKGGIYPAFVASTIDQIAKEMLEEMHDE